MSQTTMKVDRDVLIDLRAIAAKANRSPQKHLRFLVAQEKAKLLALKQRATLSPEQQARADTVARVQASEALEGYAPLTSGVAFELEQKWILGEISLEEKGRLLAEHYGVELAE